MESNGRGVPRRSCWEIKYSAYLHSGISYRLQTGIQGLVKYFVFPSMRLHTRVNSETKGLDMVEHANVSKRLGLIASM
jgi:hypothetical protein